jgi:hypothetical protein
MAELHQIVGAILRDISKARLSSDIYSRAISRIYEQDNLLRRFPSPRAEIQEVDIDLKFSIADVVLETTQNESKEATAAELFERASDEITGKFIETALNVIGQKPEWGEKAWVDNAKRWIASAPFRVSMRQDILRYLIDSYTSLVDYSGRLDQVAAFKGIVSTISKTFTQELSEMERSLRDRGDEKQMEGKPTDLAKYGSAILAQMDLKSKLTSLQEKLSKALITRGDCRVDVEVAADRLSKTPEVAISTLKIKAVVRNYVWTQMEVKPDGRVWRSLNPE